MRVDVLYAKFSPRGKAIADIVTSVFFFIFIGTMLVDRLRASPPTRSASASISFTEWGIQYWPVKLAIPIGAALLLLQGISQADQGHHDRHAQGSLSHGHRDRHRMADAAAVRRRSALLLMLGLPMAFCTGSLATIFLFVFGNGAVLNMMPSRIFPFMTDYQLSAVPLFIFMAAMLEKAGHHRGAVRRHLQVARLAEGRPRVGHRASPARCSRRWSAWSARPK